MYATEFQTVVDQPYLHIPEYDTLKGHTVRVVVLDLGNDTLTKKNTSKDDFFEKITKNPKQIKNVTFLSREEVNER
jgi:hypothetical protein